MNTLISSPRDRLKRIRERLGALPATVIILVLIGPVWIGYARTVDRDDA